jgi:hypothetical protein
VWGWDKRQFLGSFGIRIELDTTGNAKPDYGIGIDSGEDGYLGCGLFGIRHKRHWNGAMVDASARATGCRVRYADLKVTKRIGWRVTAQDFGVGGGDDSAPDGGSFIYR